MGWGLWIGAREAGRGENETGVTGTMNVMRTVAGTGVGGFVERRVLEGVGMGGSEGVRPAADQVDAIDGNMYPRTFLIYLDEILSYEPSTEQATDLATIISDSTSARTVACWSIRFKTGEGGW